MNSALPFLFDPVAGEVLSYEDLARPLAIARLRVPLCCRPRKLSDVFIAILRALVTDADLTLVDTDLSDAELAALGLDDARLTETVPRPVVHAHDDLATLLARLLRESRTHLTLYTSGSTGLPKEVRHPLANLCRVLRVDERHAADVWGFAYNPTHIAGVQVFLQALFNRNPLVNLFQLPRDTVRHLVNARGVTHLSATPSFYRLLLPAGDPLNSIRSVTLGGERTDASLLERLRPLFPNARFRNLYASTEAGTLLAADGDVFSIPLPLADVVRIRDSQLEIHRSLLGEFGGGTTHPESWYATGDVVELVSETPLRFRIVSRDRDWINVGGNKVNPAEVEAVLLTHPAVRETRVVGRANSVLGHLLVAEVVPAGVTPDEAELRRFLNERLQPFKVPRLLRFVTELSRTRTGKLKRDV